MIELLFGESDFGLLLLLLLLLFGTKDVRTSRKKGNEKVIENQIKLKCDLFRFTILTSKISA